LHADVRGGALNFSELVWYGSGTGPLRLRGSKTTGFNVSIAFLASALSGTSNSSLMTPLPCGKSYGKHPALSGPGIGQRNGHGIRMYNFSNVCCDGAQDLPQVEARRDSGRQIQEQLKPVFLRVRSRFCAHGLC
jgi:hypothetical protein